MNEPLPNIIIVGETGSGKSSSLRNLNDDSVAFIDTEVKGLPFANRARKYFPCTSPSQIKAARDAIAKDNAVRIVITDSWTKIAEMELEACKAMFKGFDIYSNLETRLRDHLKSFKSSRVINIVTALPEIVGATADSGGEYKEKRAYVPGRALEGKVEAEFLIAMYTQVLPRDGNKDIMDYFLLTNRHGICPAKSPMGLFDKIRVPNDLREVLKVVESKLVKSSEVAP
jgi:hypothetical protein